MVVSAVQLTNNGNRVIDRVLARREKAKVRRHRKLKVELRRKAGVSKTELLGILKVVHFTPTEQKKLIVATKQASRVFGYAGSR